MPSLANPLILPSLATDTPAQSPSQLLDLHRFALALFDFSFSFNLYEKYFPKGQGKASNSASAKPSKQQVNFNINVRLLGYLKAHHRFLDMFISFHFYHNQ